MQQTRRGCLIAGFLISIALGSSSSEAQYSGNFQTNIISGVTSNWSFGYVVGSATFADALLIENGGVLVDGQATVGLGSSSSNNLVLVTDIGSVWSNNNRVFVGQSGAANSLVISNGGSVISLVDGVIVGVNATSSGNNVLVTDPGSILKSVNNLTVGQSGLSNTMMIVNGGKVFDGEGILGSECSQSGCISTSYSSVVVSGAGSTWSNGNSLVIGLSGWCNSLVISNGGNVFSTDGNFKGSAIGYYTGSNCVLVSGTGSLWSTPGYIKIGNVSTANSLVISNGGVVVDGNGAISFNPGSSGNMATVTGSGSVWSNGILNVGNDGGASTLTIINSGAVVSSNSFIGNFLTSSSNSVYVTNIGALQSDTLYVGYQGSSNSLVVSGGSVFATNLVVGAASTTCDNLLQVDVTHQLFGQSTVIVTNALGNAVLEVRHGALVLAAGVVQADTLVITNSCAQFVHTGGTLIVGNVVLDPNTFRIVSVTPQGNDLLVTWMMAPGATNTLQVAAGGPGNSYNTNGFTDIFIVTNNTTVGTVTNYLDIGAATNAPARYYRARLVP
jgi:T5SS/PEP-CTERM-associated repeat protein